LRKKLLNIDLDHIKVLENLDRMRSLEELEVPTGGEIKRMIKNPGSELFTRRKGSLPPGVSEKQEDILKRSPFSGPGKKNTKL
jgi:hypothetical protein